MDSQTIAGCGLTVLPRQLPLLLLIWLNMGFISQNDLWTALITYLSRGGIRWKTAIVHKAWLHQWAGWMRQNISSLSTQTHPSSQEECSNMMQQNFTDHRFVYKFIYSHTLLYCNMFCFPCHERICIEHLMHISHYNFYLTLQYDQPFYSKTNIFNFSNVISPLGQSAMST